MEYYEENKKIIQKVRSDLYELLCENRESQLQVYVGDALNGEKFLAVLKDNRIIPLNSTYDPAHEVKRFALQYEAKTEKGILFLFGFGNGAIIRELLSGEYPIERCIVYEPSLDIFKKAMEEFDLTDLLKNDKLYIMVEASEKLERFLYGEMNYRNWKIFKFARLSKYKELFPAEFGFAEEIYNRMHEDRMADMRTLIRSAQSGMINEVHAMKWMIDCKTLDALKDSLPVQDIPCIIVAAGPSLEKNVDVLKQAKGKAFIICVDTAVKYLLERDIIPDLLCTVDPIKGTSFFTRPEIRNIPIAISTDSDHNALESIDIQKAIYISITNDFYKRLFREQGTEVGYFDGGGSVGTVCFQIGIELGFHTVIIIGQDLAFTNDKAHAGMGMVKESDFVYNMLMVDGYYGEKVLTRGDFKHYLDWYNMRIPELTDRLIINATEGGAKLKGAVQMPFQEAVDTYCIKHCDVAQCVDRVPGIWDTMEKKEDFYEEIKKKYQYFLGFKRRIKEGINLTDRAILLLKRKNYQQKELQEIDKKLDKITQEVGEKEGMVILVKRMIETDITMTDDLHEEEEDLEQESIRLYGKMKKYLEDLLEAVSELLPLWQQVMEEINQKYKFE